jgi:hypothetical protein
MRAGLRAALRDEHDSGYHQSQTEKETDGDAPALFAGSSDHMAKRAFFLTCQPFIHGGATSNVIEKVGRPRQVSLCSQEKQPRRQNEIAHERDKPSRNEPSHEAPPGADKRAAPRDIVTIEILGQELDVGSLWRRLDHVERRNRENNQRGDNARRYAQRTFVDRRKCPTECALDWIGD